MCLCDSPLIYHALLNHYAQFDRHPPQNISEIVKTPSPSTHLPTIMETTNGRRQSNFERLTGQPSAAPYSVAFHLSARLIIPYPPYHYRTVLVLKNKGKGKRREKNSCETSLPYSPPRLQSIVVLSYLPNTPNPPIYLPLVGVGGLWFLAVSRFVFTTQLEQVNGNLNIM